jgi:dTDP-4-dehydrorhamnose reductase
MAGQFLILRLPVLYGLSERNDSGFLRGALVNVLGGQVIELDDDQVRYPTHFQDVAIGAEFLLREGHRGIFHLSSQEAATRYSFARTLARLLGVSGDHLIPGGQKRLDAVPRPHHCKLSTDRFLASGGPVPRPLSAVLPLLVEEIQPR